MLLWINGGFPHQTMRIEHFSSVLLPPWCFLNQAFLAVERQPHCSQTKNPVEQRSGCSLVWKVSVQHRSGSSQVEISSTTQIWLFPGRNFQWSKDLAVPRYGSASTAKIWLFQVEISVQLRFCCSQVWKVPVQHGSGCSQLEIPIPHRSGCSQVWKVSDLAVPHFPVLELGAVNAQFQCCSEWSSLLPCAIYNLLRHALTKISVI